MTNWTMLKADPNTVAELWYAVSDSGRPPAQGDQLWGLIVPIAFVGDDAITRSTNLELDSIILTQSCDLEHGKAGTVLMAPFHTVAEWIEENPADLGRLEDIREGYDVSLYLLPAWPKAPFDMAREDRIIDLGELRTVERDVIDSACSNGLPRISLRSPAREHFAQAVARSFMRVGLPQDMPSFKLERAGREESVLPQGKANPMLYSSGAILARDLPVAIHKRRRQSVAQTFVLLTTRGHEPVVTGAGCDRAHAERSLMRQLLLRWNWLQDGDERFVWLTDYLRPVPEET